MFFSFSKPLIVKILRFILGLVFVVAGFSKLFPLKDFLGQLLSYQIPLPEPFLFCMALVLILIEIIIGLFVLLDFELRIGLIGMQIILCLMIPATIWGSMHKAPTCGCYGNLIKRAPRMATIEDLLMLAVSFLLLPNLQNKIKNKSINSYKLFFIIFISLIALSWGIFQLNQVFRFQAESLF